ncbi:MT-A70 family methyltransferase [Mesorhizobium sp. M0088]|uniref:MT-A70 family methyltransferase n=1 Tax=Mesorhizobium sp. M0088 TaxID=2956873 RepID=UPI00333ABC80
MSLAREFVSTTKTEAQKALLVGKPVTTKEVVVATITGKLPGMIKDAARKLAMASTAAEILDARDAAKISYTTAQMAGRIAKAKGAHDQVVAAAHRAQADALEIEAAAKRRLADEYDGAQERGEIQKAGGNRKIKIPDGNNDPATAAEIGIPSKEIHDARQIRDAIAANPTAVRDALDQILKEGDEPTRAALRKAIGPAAKYVRADEQTAKKERRGEREIELAAKIHALPGKRYGVIVADPEWRFEPYSRETGMDRAADNHYPTSALEEIMARDVGSIAADDCVLFLWATAPMLPQALQVLAAWGFVYKTHAIWFKQRAGDGRGTGYWFLGEHELLLVGVRGDVVAPAMGTQARSVFLAPIGGHSEKPDVALEIIESYFPNLPKIELNRRGPARPGWDAWGNEAEEQHLPSGAAACAVNSPAVTSAAPSGNNSHAKPLAEQDSTVAPAPSEQVGALA